MMLRGFFERGRAPGAARGGLALVWLALVWLGAMAAGCAEDPCPPGQARQGRLCVDQPGKAGELPASVGDAGDARVPAAEDAEAGTPQSPDSGRPADAGADASVGGCPAGCSAPTPHCDRVRGTCVGCLHEEHCPANQPLCDRETSECVACLDDRDCPNAGAPRCDLTTRSCAPCIADTHCALFAATPLCDGTRCVQCTPERAGLCDTNVCDPRSLTCTDRPRHSAEVCRPCVAHEECAAGSYCVEEPAATGSPEYVCLPQRPGSGSCPAPLSPEVSRMGIDGVRRLVCGFSVSSCQAYLDLGRPCSDLGMCGLQRVDDSQCTWVRDRMRCAMRCESGADCPAGYSCPTSRLCMLPRPT